MRIQLSRRKGWRKPADAVVVARPSRWGNPFAVGDDGIPDRETAVARYRAWAATDPPELADVGTLRGKDLACWCALDGPCHADVLIELANRPSATDPTVSRWPPSRRRDLTHPDAGPGDPSGSADPL